MVVDAVGAAPYAHVDMADLGGADIVAVSAPSWGGPQVGALVFRDPGLLDRIPAVSLNPYARGAERLEVGGHQFALLSGLTSSIDFLAGLDESATGTRRERLETSISSLQDYQDGLFDHLMRSLAALPNVMVIGGAPTRVPTLSFTLEGGMAADKVAAHLADKRIATVSGTHGVPGCSTPSVSTTKAARSPSALRRIRRGTRSISWSPNSAPWADRSRSAHFTVRMTLPTVSGESSN